MGVHTVHFVVHPNLEPRIFGDYTTFLRRHPQPRFNFDSTITPTFCDIYPPAGPDRAEHRQDSRLHPFPYQTSCNKRFERLKDTVLETHHDLPKDLPAFIVSSVSFTRTLTSVLYGYFGL